MRRADVDRSRVCIAVPELVVEVAKATRFVDLGPKLSDYDLAGVLEYISK